MEVLASVAQTPRSSRTEKLLNGLPGVYEMVGLGVLSLVTIWVILRLRAAWREDDGPAAAEHDLLSQLDDLSREGDLTIDEYRLIKRRLALSAQSRFLEKDAGKTPTPRPAAKSLPAATTADTDDQEDPALPPTQSLSQPAEGRPDERDPA